MTTAVQTFRLPRLEDTFSVFPNNGINPHYSECLPQAEAWIDQYYKVVCGPEMRHFMKNCKFELEGAYTYPYASADNLRMTMDFLNLMWIYDEFTDTLSGDEAIKASIIVQRTLQEHDYDDGSWICRMMTDFRRNYVEKFGSNVARRFVAHFCKYAEFTGREAELRWKNEVLDIQAYMTLRRETGGVRCVFDLAEHCLGLDLPQYVHDDPVFISGYNAGMHLVYLDNDLFSYNMEQSKDHSGANMVTVVIKSKGIDLQSAIDFVAGYCECVTQELLDAKLTLSSRADPVFSTDAVRVLEAVCDWARGNDEWGFQTARFLGDKRKAVKETRMIELRKPFEGFANLKE